MVLLSLSDSLQSPPRVEPFARWVTARSVPSPAGSADPRAPSASEKSWGPRAQVLVVEDSPSDAFLVQAALSRFGSDISCSFAASLQGARVSASASPPDVIVLDLSLPDSEGIDTLERVRTAFSEVPVIVLTGCPEQQLAVQALRSGAEDFLNKNDLRALEQAVRRAIQRGRAAPAGVAGDSPPLSAALGSVADVVAAITHEINTPLQFIGDNLAFVTRAFELLLPCVSWDGTRHGSPAAGDSMQLRAAPELSLHKLEYLKQQVPTALAEAREGLRRIADVIVSLKCLMVDAGEERAEVDIHQLIEGTLVLFESRCPHGASVVRNYAAELPRVIAYREQLGRALLHLFVKTAQSSAAPHRAPIAALCIRTEHTASGVQIAIEEGLAASAAEVLRQAPDSARASGFLERAEEQALALVRSTVEEMHGGTFHVSRRPERGVKFVLSLPVAT